MNRSRHEKKPDTDHNAFGDNPWKAMGLVGAVGADLAVCIGVGYWLGSKADESGGILYSMIGMGAGFIVGAVTVFFMIRTFAGGRKN